MQLKQLVEGWRNNILPPKEKEELINSISKERISICEKCEKHSKNHKTRRPDAHCTECGCTLAAKTKCLSCSCPLNEPKWVALPNKEKED